MGGGILALDCCLCRLLGLSQRVAGASWAEVQLNRRIPKASRAEVSFRKRLQKTCMMLTKSIHPYPQIRGMLGTVGVYRCLRRRRDSSKKCKHLGSYLAPSQPRKQIRHKSDADQLRQVPNITKQKQIKGRRPPQTGVKSGKALTKNLKISPDAHRSGVYRCLSR